MSATEPAAARLRALAGRMIVRDGWSRAQLLDHQREALRRTVAHAVEHSPYYREVLGPSAARGEVVLGALPTLSKRTLVEEFDRLVTDPRLRRRRLERHLAGPRAAEAFLGRYEVFSTSGTTGERTLVVLDREDWELWIAVSLRAMARAGVGAGMRIAAIGSPHALHMSRRIYADLRSADAPDLSVLTPAGELRAALEAQRPHGLMGYATLMRQLAEDRLDGRLSIKPRIVVCSSEPLPHGGGQAPVGILLHAIGQTIDQQLPACLGRHGAVEQRAPQLPKRATLERAQGWQIRRACCD